MDNRGAQKKTEGVSLSEPTRRRLPAYYRALVGLYAEGYLKISSEKLAEKLGLAPSQVRTDMLAIGCGGHKGYGYLITEAYKRIGEVMRIHDVYKAVAIGNGALADAVCGCSLFTKRGIKLVGRFSSVVAENGGEILPLCRLEDFCLERQVDIMIFACGAGEANECLKIADRVGIRGIMNFSEADIASEKFTVRNLHIEDALMMLCAEIE